MPTESLQYLSRNWGWIALRGVAAVLFGVFAIIWPGVTLAALVIFWGAYAIADGLAALFAAWRIRDGRGPFWSLVIVGVLGVAAGVVAFLWPGITALVLLMLIAAWAIVTGIFEVIAAIRLRKEIANEWLLALSGVLSVIFGLLLFFYPSAGALAMLAVIGAFAIVFGIVRIMLAFRLRSHQAGKATA